MTGFPALAPAFQGYGRPPRFLAAKALIWRNAGAAIGRHRSYMGCETGSGGRNNDVAFTATG